MLEEKEMSNEKKNYLGGVNLLDCGSNGSWFLYGSYRGRRADNTYNTNNTNHTDNPNHPNHTDDTNHGRRGAANTIRT